MRKRLVLLSMLMAMALPAASAVSIGIELPGVSIGLNVPVYPRLVRVPNYPVYYAPELGSNYFFYDGMYWVYQQDNWYASDWYNGPWGQVSPAMVPLFVLRIPVRYYRSPPEYFRGWRNDAPPRWGDHWGASWQQQRSGWDRWNRSAVPAPAPLPVYQRRYGADRYPPPDRQPLLRNENYRHQPRDPVVREHFQAQPPMQAAPAPGRRPPAVAPVERHPEPAPRAQRPEPTPRAQRPDSPREATRGPEPGRQRAPEKDERDKGEKGGRGDKGDKADKADKGDDRGPDRHK